MMNDKLLTVAVDRALIAEEALDEVMRTFHGGASEKGLQWLITRELEAAKERLIQRGLVQDHNRPA